jgi:beta-mannanase
VGLQTAFGVHSGVQHVSAVFKSLASNISMMWSPVGNPGCQNYYPGTAAVDYVGLSIYELPAASAAWYGSAQSFAQLMNMKYPLVSGFDNPVFVAELGDATTDHQAAWVTATFAATRKYPLLKALIWFNAQDAASWGPPFGTPDWRISPAIF